MKKEQNYSKLTFAATIQRLPMNTRILLMVQPLWVIPYSLVNSYSSKFMIDQGLTPMNIGSISSVESFLRMVIALFAGYIVNKFGRRWVLGTVDIIGWAIPMLLYAFAHTYWQFMLAALINTIVIINNVAYQCFLTEDVEPTDRLHVIRYFTLVNSAFGLLIPITGLLIGRFTFDGAIRGLYIFAFVCMLLFGAIRLVFLRETTYGMYTLRERKTNPVKPFSSFVKPFLYVARTKTIFTLFFINIIINFSQGMQSQFFMPYATDHIHFSESLSVIFPFVSTAVSICIYIFVIPLIKNMPRSILYSIIFYFAGAICMVLASFLGWYMILIRVVLVACASSTVTPVISTLIANEVSDEFRADTIGLLNVLSMLCMIPVGFVGGSIYQFSPLTLMVVSTLLSLLTFLLYLLIYKKVSFGVKAAQE